MPHIKKKTKNNDYSFKIEQKKFECICTWVCRGVAVVCSHKIIQNAFNSFLLFCKFSENIPQKNINGKSTVCFQYAITYIAVDSHND